MDRLTVVGVSPNYYNMPVWLAQDCGLFEREGLDVIFELYEAIETVMARAANGDAEIGRNATELVILNRETGGKQVVVAGNLNRLPFSLISRPHIKTLEDLRGAVIGVSSLAAGSSSLVMRVLAGHGLEYPRDYRILAMGPMVTRWEMLRSGQIDAGLQGIPYNFLARDHGYNDLPFGLPQFRDFSFSCFSANADWAVANKDVLVRFLRAIVRACEIFHNDRELSVNVSLKHMEAHGFGRNYCKRAWDTCVADGIMSSDGGISINGVEALIDVSSLIRELPARAITRPEDYLDLSYLNVAQASLPRGAQTTPS